MWQNGWEYNHVVDAIRPVVVRTLEIISRVFIRHIILRVLTYMLISINSSPVYVLEDT